MFDLDTFSCVLQVIDRCNITNHIRGMFCDESIRSISLFVHGS